MSTHLQLQLSFTSTAVMVYLWRFCCNFSSASLVSLFMVYQYVDFEADYFMPLFFSFLAAITFPHTVVIGLMKHKNG